MYLTPDSARRDAKEAGYPGKPLGAGEIRLVKLHPGAWTDPIVCELTDAQVNTAQYQVLSYVWGSRQVTRQIRLNDRMYPVTVNLESALRHLRAQSKNELILWVDALCINQKDMEERTQQVQQMDRIYEKCQQGIVYLGDTLSGTARSDESPPVLRFEDHALPDLGELDLGGASKKRPDVLDVFLFIWELSCAMHPYQVRAFGCKDNVEDTQEMQRRYRERIHLFETLRRFMNTPITPWWTRIWVI